MTTLVYIFIDFNQNKKWVIFSNDKIINIFDNEEEGKTALNIINKIGVNPYIRDYIYK